MHLSKEVIQKKLLLWSKLYPSYLKIDFTIVKLTADAVALKTISCQLNGNGTISRLLRICLQANLYTLPLTPTETKQHQLNKP